MLLSTFELFLNISIVFPKLRVWNVIKQMFVIQNFRPMCLGLKLDLKKKNDIQPGLHRIQKIRHGVQYTRENVFLMKSVINFYSLLSITDRQY